MLACDFPFNDDTVQGLAYKIKNSQPDMSKLKTSSVSDDCIDLIYKLLAKDKDKRISIEEALDHVWFKKEHICINQVSLTESEKESALYSFKSYNKVNKLFKAFKIFNTKIANMENVKQFRDLFLKFDEDNNGYLDKDEFFKLMKYLSSDGMSD